MDQQRHLDEEPEGDIYLTAMRAVFWVFCIGVFAFAAVQVWPVVVKILNVLNPFIIGLILAYVLYPVVRFVENRLRLGRSLGIVVVALGIFGIVLGFIAILVPLLYTQIKSLLDSLSDFFSQGKGVDRILSQIDPDTRKQIRDFIHNAIDRARQNLQSAMSQPSDVLKPVATGSFEAAKQTFEVAFSIFGWIGGFVASMALTSVITIYYLSGMDKIPSIIRTIMPGCHRERLWATMLKANNSVGGFIRGQLISCSGVGILSTILMFIAGPHAYAILIGFGAGVLNFIPYLGPWAGATPAVLWAFFTPQFNGFGEKALHASLIVGGFALIQAIDGIIFQPFIVGKSASLHPLLVVFALVVGGQFGIGGMIVAVPVACVVKVIFVEYYWKSRADFLALPPPPDGQG